MSVRLAVFSPLPAVCALLGSAGETTNDGVRARGTVDEELDGESISKSQSSSLFFGCVLDALSQHAMNLSLHQTSKPSTHLATFPPRLMSNLCDMVMLFELIEALLPLPPAAVANNELKASLVDAAEVGWLGNGDRGRMPELTAIGEVTADVAGEAALNAWLL